ncbi:hypothetical protein [Absidia glauca]|uniref:Uncharacterized protein n=1 Tax=Absidia glauca TaxID=4829 RepID=A0A163K9A4_ABSGL|nr:hypothetical protein [Absidia glauca]
MVYASMIATRCTSKATEWSDRKRICVHVKLEGELPIPFTRKMRSKKSGEFQNGECYRQNHPDRTNLRILDFADNKDLHGGGLSESLTSVPVIDGTQLEMKIKLPLPTHSSNNVCFAL